MIQKVTLPKLGETVEVSTIDKWRKNEGDPVAVGDVLCDITTDKATLEVESYYRGTLLKVLAPAGKELPVGALIAVIGDPGERIPEDILAQAVAAAPAKKAAPQGAAAPGAPPAAAAVAAEAPAASAGGRIVASPRARRAAEELLVDLSRVRGTGPGGRIVEADVFARAKGGTAVKASPVARKMAAQMGVDLAAVAAAGGKVMKEDVLRAASAASTPLTQVVPPTVPGKPGEVVPLSAMRRIIAERMLLSKQTMPCYYLEMDADVTDLVCLRNKMNARPGAQKVTFNDFVLKACGVALKMFPAVNSRRVEGGIERRAEVSIGFAVSLDDGLIVPVVRNVDSKSLEQVAAESAGLVERARSKKLQPHEYQNGCMTVSNLGMYGIRSFIPVVNPGESSILGLGMIADRVVFRQGGIQVRKIMALTLSADHRLVDGAMGAQFLEVIRDALEAPQRLVE
jgi:pyruvate dehydrogenase E2 component (dihydrolipoamide acetyltransferase)